MYIQLRDSTAEDLVKNGLEGYLRDILIQEYQWREIEVDSYIQSIKNDLAILRKRGK